MLYAKYRFHAGFILALLTATFVYLLVEKSSYGYELRAMGLNPIAAKFKGINPARTLDVGDAPQRRDRRTRRGSGTHWVNPGDCGQISLSTMGSQASLLQCWPIYIPSGL